MKDFEEFLVVNEISDGPIGLLVRLYSEEGNGRIVDVVYSRRVLNCAKSLHKITKILQAFDLNSPKAEKNLAALRSMAMESEPLAEDLERLIDVFHTAFQIFAEDEELRKKGEYLYPTSYTLQ